jgi:tripartite-type tricarboxylate transporter receptor subunit TctC
MSDRRQVHITSLLAASIGACLCPSHAPAQSYPARPVRFIVAFAPGGSVDVVARVVGQKLGERLGQQVVIDNRPGAGGNVSAEIAARAAPDGYTIYISSASLVANASLYRKIAYDPIKDFAPITLLASAQSVLVAHPGFPAKTVKDLIALAKKSPGKINYASPGSGSSGHLTMELFKSMAGIDLVHVPYKVMSQLQSDVIAGQIPLAFSTIPGALPHIQSGRMLPLAVSGARRSPALPNVPTVAEAGVPGYEAATWYPVLAPAGTPKAIVDALNAHLVAIVKAPDVQERFVSTGVEPIGSTPQELAAHIKSELRKWAKVVQLSGARVD